MACLKHFLKHFDKTFEEEPEVNILFREKETEFILNFFGPRSSVPFPFLFIYGHTATGKTLLLSQILKNNEFPHVWIDCHETRNSKLIFKSIAEQLCSSPDYESKNINCCELINIIKKALIDRKETMYVVFDAAEVIRAEDTVMSTFIRLQELTRMNICTIFVSELPWIKFKSLLTSIDPITVHFPNYTKDQMAEILSCVCPENVDEKMYVVYISIILKTFFTVTRNLRELRHQAEINIEKYFEPVHQDPDFEISNLRLWRNIEPVLKEAMRSVYLREISGSKFKLHCSSEENPDSKAKKLSTLTDAKYTLTRELPFYSKFLLLAAYFASYNQPKSDYKHFVRNQGKQKKKRITKKMEKNRHLLGPKPFSLDRMLSIFFAIVGEKVFPTAMIFSQISSLVSLRLLQRISREDELSCPKYKCLAELDLVEKIGKTVEVDLMGYLDDFL